MQIVNNNTQSQYSLILDVNHTACKIKKNVNSSLSIISITMKMTVASALPN